MRRSPRINREGPAAVVSGGRGRRQRLDAIDVQQADHHDPVEEVGEAVLLALEHAPELALPLIRKGLLSDIPMNRSQIAAILTLIAKPWSRRELLGALQASDDQEKTADARAALLESGDEEAEKAVLAWEERNPHEN
jgi:hypothetical protein